MAFGTEMIRGRIMIVEVVTGCRRGERLLEPFGERAGCGAGGLQLPAELHLLRRHTQVGAAETHR